MQLQVWRGAIVHFAPSQDPGTVALDVGAGREAVDFPMAEIDRFRIIREERWTGFGRGAGEYPNSCAKSDDAVANGLHLHEYPRKPSRDRACAELGYGLSICPVANP